MSDKNITAAEDFTDVGTIINAEVVEQIGSAALAIRTAEEAFTGDVDYFTFMDLEDPMTKLAVYSAIQNPDHKLREWATKHPGESIAMVNALIHPVTLQDENSGESVNTWRAIIFDAEGQTFVAVSEGVTNSLQKMFSIIGSPDTWAAPLNVIPKEIGTRNGMNRVMILDIEKPKPVAAKKK